MEVAVSVGWRWDGALRGAGCILAVHHTCFTMDQWTQIHRETRVMDRKVAVTIMSGTGMRMRVG